jgi:integrase
MVQRRVCYADEALNDYFAELDTLGLAPNTVLAYKGYLARFGRICAAVARENGKRAGLTVAEIDGRVISRYFATSTGEQGNLNNMLHPLRMFLKWCVSLGWLDAAAPTRLLGSRKYKKPQRKPKHYIEAELFPDMLDAGCLIHPSQRMAMALLLYTLARRGEVGFIKLEHVNLVKGVINIYRDKRDRWTEVGISPELREELYSYLAWYGEQYDLTVFELMAMHPGWHLVPAIKRVYQRDELGRIGKVASITINPLRTPVHLERLVKKVLTWIGVEGTRSTESTDHVGEGCHTIRRSGARAMLDHLTRDLGHDRALLTVSTMLDHDDPRQTLIYIDINKERDELNGWLQTNSMYGAKGRRPASVVPIRRTA